MNKLFAVLLLFVVSCSAPVEKKKQDEVTVPVALNPNGDSELAILMRKMADWTEKTRDALSKGDSLPAYPSDFVQILTAERSDPGFDENTIRLMGSSYLSSLELLYKGRKEDRADLFNSSVKACEACHNNICPGPLKRIGKMLIPQ